MLYRLTIDNGNTEESEEFSSVTLAKVAYRKAERRVHEGGAHSAQLEQVDVDRDYDITILNHIDISDL